MQPEKILFALLQAAVCEDKVAEEVRAACTPDALNQVYVLAQRHDLAHLAGHVLGGLKLPDSEPLKKLKQAAFLAVYRHAKLDYEFERICNALEQAEIPYIPLKGAVIRNLYPESWMRTSCDIDILIHEEDLEKAVACITNSLSYTTDQKKYYHDMSLFSESGIHLELHFSIQENMESIDTLLCRVWDYATPVTAYRYALESNFLVFHLLAHMSYHFTGGGCGIRSFLDIYLLKTQNTYDEKVLRGYLELCGIERFYDSVLSLIAVWFENQTPLPITEQMEAFVLAGGTYGSEEQRITIQKERSGGQIGYLINRIFLPYRYLKIKYRVLERYPILFPVMQIRRWVEVFSGDNLRRSVDEVRINKRTDKKQAEEINDILRQIGL